MKFSVHLTHELDDGARVQWELGDLDTEIAGPEDIGLSLDDAKAILGRLQGLVVDKQVERWLAEQRQCPSCGGRRRLKDYQPAQFRTAFGTVKLRSPRLYRCRCEKGDQRTISPLSELMGSHVAPELEYLESKWAARVSFAAAASMMREVLPVAPTTNSETVRQHTYRVAARMDDDLGRSVQSVLKVTV